LREPFVDYVVQHDGEERGVDLVNAIVRGDLPTEIDGVGYKRSDGTIVVSNWNGTHRNIDKWLPDWEAVDIERYIRPYRGCKRVLMGFMASRGCPHKCAFCYNERYNKRLTRRMAPYVAIAEINRLAACYDLDGIFLFDDNFTVNPSWAKRVLAGISITPIQLKIRIDRTDRDLDAAMERAGVPVAFAGVESGSRATLQRMGKRYTPEAVSARFAQIAASGAYQVKAAFIVGLPGESLAEYRETLRFIARCAARFPIDRIAYYIGYFLPYPGTRFHDDCVSGGWKSPESLDEWAEYAPGSEMMIPWTRGRFLHSREIRKLRVLLVWMEWASRRCRVLYWLLRMRFVCSGTLLVRALGRVENVLWWVRKRAWRRTQ